MKGGWGAVKANMPLRGFCYLIGFSVLNSLIPEENFATFCLKFLRERILRQIISQRVPVECDNTRESFFKCFYCDFHYKFLSLLIDLVFL